MPSGPTTTDLVTRVTRTKGELVAEAIEAFTIATVALSAAREKGDTNATHGLAHQQRDARRDLVQALQALQSRPVLRVV